VADEVDRAGAAADVADLLRHAVEVFEMGQLDQVPQELTGACPKACPWLARSPLRACPSQQRDRTPPRTSPPAGSTPISRSSRLRHPGSPTPPTRVIGRETTVEAGPHDGPRRRKRDLPMARLHFGHTVGKKSHASPSCIKTPDLLSLPDLHVPENPRFGKPAIVGYVSPFRAAEDSPRVVRTSRAQPPRFVL
jgi:hypothetical protein